ncbi:MAG: hypothetical protein ABWY06_21255 [Pseudomonas sp.]|uniref:tyrosine-protein kinase family protein n=1 Tax=Pseudomonas sp. TaxID=306 RepID=UPI003395BB62
MNILVNQETLGLAASQDPQLTRPMQELMARVLRENRTRPMRQLMVVGVARGVGASFVAQQAASHLAEVFGQVLIIELCTEGRDDHRLDGDLEHLVSSGSLVARTRLSLNTGLRLFSLENEELRRLLTRLHERFPVVLWDMPPPTVTSVALVAAKVLDGIILVAQAGRTRRPVARHVRDRLEESGGQFLGVVLNRSANFIPDWLYRWL